MDMIEIQFTKDECEDLVGFIDDYLAKAVYDHDTKWAANICSAWRALKAGAKHGE